MERSLEADRRDESRRDQSRPDAAERWTSTVVLGDGTSAVIRPITPSDAPGLAAFHQRQSAESRYFRYFSPKPELTEAELTRFTTVDFVDRAAFVVEEHGEFVAWASYERWHNRDDAEVAFQVDDGHQGKGIATLMLEHLAAVARSNGIQRFTAQTLGDNRSMLTVFAKAGWPVHRRFESGVIDVDFSLDDTSTFIDSVERREQRADSRSMARVLLPTSIAVIGASDIPDSVGRVLWHIVGGDQRRRTYPVNPNHAVVGGVTAYPSVVDVPDDVGLAIVAVPAAALAATLQQCIDKRVRGAVVITTASDGSTGAGAAVPDLDVPAIVAHARRSGLRIIGPGSMGIASPRPDIALNASLAEVDLHPGNVAISMQSGTLGIGLLRLATQLQLPISWFVSLGDKADVSGNDLLQFWEDDDATEVVAIYTESLGNPRKFARIARRVAQRRPVVVVRTGAALIGAGNEALYRDTGVIEVPTVTAMLDTARVLSTQPLPAGNRVAVVSNSSSPAVLAAATLRAVELEVVEPPVALSFRSTADDYARAVRAALDDPGVDAVMVVHAPPLIVAIGAAAEAIHTACAGATKPVVAVMLGAGDGPIRPGSGVPSFAFPEQAAAVLGRIAAYAAWRRTEGADGADVDRLTDQIDIAAAGALIDGLLPEGDRGPAEADPEVMRSLLACYGVEMPVTRRVPTDDPAVASAAAEEMGFPVAVKATGRRVGRTAEAGVALDLGDRDEVERAVTTMRAHLGDDAATVLVQRMAPPGVDIRIRIRDDERVGPVVTIGLGGIQADAIGDEVSRLAPVSESTALTMVGETRAATALGADGYDRLADVVVRIAQLGSDHPQIAELDLNPVVVNPDGCCVVDARLVVRRPDRAEPAVRRLE